MWRAASCAQRGQRREGGNGDSDVVADAGGLDDGLAGLFEDELAAQVSDHAALFRIPIRLATRSRVSSARSSCALGVLAGDDGADARLAFGHGRKRDARGHHAFVEERPRELHGGAAFAHDDGRDGRLCGRRGDAADVEAGALQFPLEIPRILPEALDALGLTPPGCRRPQCRRPRPRADARWRRGMAARGGRGSQSNLCDPQT